MSSRPLSKSERRELDRLNALVHERELSNSARDLQKEFESWNRDEMNVFELNEKIHQFHDGVSRDLYKRYAMHRPDTEMNVASAIVRGILKESEVPAILLEIIQRSIDLCRQWAQEDK